MARYRLSIAKYNIQGFNCGMSMLSELLDKNDINTTKEHRLINCNLCELFNHNNLFDIVAKSAMEKTAVLADHMV